MIAARSQRRDNAKMEIYLVLMLCGFGAYVVKNADQRRRIALLGGHLQNYQLEKLMETLAEGYLRALDADDPARSEQILGLMNDKETALSDQFQRFAAEMSRQEPDDLRVSTLTWAVPFADRLFPAATFDLRKALDIHARGIAEVVRNGSQRSSRDRAFTLSAEMLLMQHTCHWYCKSKTIASARMLARHRTTYERAVAAVSPETRQAYLELLAG